MPDEITRLISTMHELERLLVKFETDAAARLHRVDYQATIAMLCDSFDAQMSALMQTGGETVTESRSTGISHATARVRGAGRS